MTTKTIEEREQLLAEHVKAAAAAGYRSESQTHEMAIVVAGKPVNHLLHFLIGFPTFGFWWIMWIILAASGGEKRWMISVDEYGNVAKQKV